MEVSERYRIVSLNNWNQTQIGNLDIDSATA
jgi:hypothetical protein